MGVQGGEATNWSERARDSRARGREMREGVMVLGKESHRWTERPCLLQALKGKEEEIIAGGRKNGHSFGMGCVPGAQAQGPNVGG